MRVKAYDVRPFLFGMVLFLFLISSCTTSKNNSVDELSLQSTDVHYMYYEDIGMWNHIYKETPEYIIPQCVPVSMLIPHHDITTGRQNSFYKAVSNQCNPSVIVIVSPDHFENGKNLITMPDETVFETPEGNLSIDYDLISKLKASEELKNVISLQNDLWKMEHGIFVHTPFIKHYFPDAKVVPVLVKPLSTDSEFEYFKTLGKILAELLPKDALVVASVDCSHYQIPSVTLIHDESTINTFLYKEDPRNAEIDSPESVRVLYSYNECRKAGQTVVVDQSSTYDYIPQEKIVCTSHFYLTFYDDSVCPLLDDFYNEAQKTSQRIRKKTDGIKQTVLIAGSGKTNAGIKRTWKWDRYKTSQDPVEQLLRDAAGTEARFFWGFDALIFDPLPGSVYQSNIHGTKLKVQTFLQSDFNNTSSFAIENNSINILEVILENEKVIPSEQQIKPYFKYFDVIVFRDDDGVVDAVLYCKSQKNDCDNIRTVNLGICRGDGVVKGSVALLTFNEEKINMLTLDYCEPQKGVMPAIEQYEVDDL